MLTEGDHPTATAIVGGADDLFPSVQKGQFREDAPHGWACLWLLIWRGGGCDPVQVLHPPCPRPDGRLYPALWEWGGGGGGGGVWVGGWPYPLWRRSRPGATIPPKQPARH